MTRRDIFCGMVGLLFFACLGAAICTLENGVVDAQEATSSPAPPQRCPKPRIPSQPPIPLSRPEIFRSR